MNSLYTSNKDDLDVFDSSYVHKVRKVAGLPINLVLRHASFPLWSRKWPAVSWAEKPFDVFPHFLLVMVVFQKEKK